MTKRLAERDERGATAVLVAVVSISLFMVGALAVDLGQVFAKRSALHSNVDLAVMAAAAQLTSGGSCNAEVVAKATEFLTKAGNKVADQYPVDLTGSPDDNTGYIRCSNWKVELWAPRSRVDWGMARIFNAGDGVDVPAYAAAQVKSRKFATLPMYAVTGCVGGRVTVSDPTNGQLQLQNLARPSFPQSSQTHTNYVKAQPVPDSFNDTALAAPPVTTEVRLENPLLVGSEIVFTPASNLSLVVPAAATDVTLVQATQNKYSVKLPSQVVSSPGVWWVRVRSALGNYSPGNTAVAIAVGNLLACNGSLSGNFGTLKIARTENNFVIERNLIQGAEPTLKINSSSAVPCPVAQSAINPTSPTDCLSTDPGFPVAALTRGLIDGVSGLKGRLDADTMPGCSRSGTSSRTPGSYALNDDTLACFIIDPAATVTDVANGTRPQILSPDIADSVRFFQIPELPLDPSQGTSSNYPIIGFHYVFISAESPATGYNGLTMQGNKVQSLTLTFIDPDSMPDTLPAAGGEIDYLGYGPKVVVLVE